MENMITFESIEEVSIKEVEKIIKSMPNRIKKILQRKGQRCDISFFFLHILSPEFAWNFLQLKGEKYSADYAPHETNMKTTWSQNGSCEFHRMMTWNHMKPQLFFEIKKYFLFFLKNVDSCGFMSYSHWLPCSQGGFMLVSLVISCTVSR